MTILTRSSNKLYYSRPPKRMVSARWAWDKLSESGRVRTMRLIDGCWGCIFWDGEFKEIEAVTALRRSREHGTMS